MTRIAGIINLTPDSFYAGSRCIDAEAVHSTALKMRDEAAAMLDIGACSTRPGSTPASAAEELQRLEAGIPVVREACPDIPLSVDTFRPEIAAQCISRWDVRVINDISGGNEAMYRTIADAGASYILTWSEHVRVDPLTEMVSFFKERIGILHSYGVDDIIIDPGFGFGKELMQNYLILANLGILRQFGLPIMAGLSRKSMACKLLGIQPEQALEATVALNTLAASAGADWLRVHDVRSAVQAAAIAGAFTNSKDPQSKK